jgi:hypothetical protein
MDVLIPVLLVIAVGVALSQGSRGLIARTPYNNRYNDASGAREDHLD